METQRVVSDFTQLTIYTVSLGIGYFSAVVVERKKYFELFLSKSLTFWAQLRLRLLVVFSAMLFHFIGVMAASVLSYFGSQTLLAWLEMNSATHEWIRIGLVFGISGIGACYGTGATLVSMWRQHRKHFPPPGDPPDPPPGSPWKGA